MAVGRRKGHDIRGTWNGDTMQKRPPTGEVKQNSAGSPQYPLSIFVRTRRYPSQSVYCPALVPTRTRSKSLEPGVHLLCSDLTGDRGDQLHVS